ncbi:LytR/AlgR family response regulator transcription factor [Anditalea andensis]|uniref:Chemotaxis protein CheY n=1 Tax=Anditalea andensis TaxID=1048983 RepID=A0A074KPT7_9BACT|nr:LytTR family DNA-binding domain-containing protein [Anditalea andensis]KEO71971.1 hypothetical protein EL17_20875 [Anditalea andensis]
MITCIIVDDEPLAIEVLENYIEQTPDLMLLFKCRNAFEASEYLKNNQPDLMFLDIEMPLIKGTQFLQSLETPPKTILATAYREYAFDGYELDVVDYLLKPIAYDRFLKAIQKFKEQAETPLVSEEDEKYLLIKDRWGIQRIKHSDVLYIEGCKDYVKINTATKSYMMLQTMKETEILLGEKFVRVHRSYIAGLGHLKLIHADSLVLSNDKSIPVGNKFKKALMDKLKGG